MWNEVKPIASLQTMKAFLSNLAISPLIAAPHYDMRYVDLRGLHILHRTECCHRYDHHLGAKLSTPCSGITYVSVTAQ